MINTFELEKKLYNERNQCMLYFHLNRNNTKFLMFFHKKIMEVLPKEYINILKHATAHQYKSLYIANEQLMKHNKKLHKK